LSTKRAGASYRGGAPAAAAPPGQSLPGRAFRAEPASRGAGAPAPALKDKQSARKFKQKRAGQQAARP